MKKMLLIRAGAMGDLIFCLPLINKLYDIFGEKIQIDLLVTETTKQVVEKNPFIHKIFTLKSRKLPLLFNKGKLRLIQYSWIEPYDYVINLEDASFFNSMMRLIHSKYKLGHPYLTGPIHYPANLKHATDIYIYKLLSFFKVETKKLELTSNKKMLFGVDRLALKRKYNLSDRYILLSPATSWHKRKENDKIDRAWPENHWISLMRLLDHEDHAVYCIGAERNKNWLRSLVERSNSNTRVITNTSIPELITLVEHTKVLVSVDTGMVHIAANTGTPVVVLYGPSSEAETGPYITNINSNKVKILTNTSLTCRPCSGAPHVRKNCNDNICMTSINPKIVLDAILQLVR